MKHPEGDPSGWTYQQRRSFISETLNWGQDIFSVMPDPDGFSNDCQKLRRKLVDMGFYFELVNDDLHISAKNPTGDVYRFRIWIGTVGEPAIEHTDPSENRAVVIAACRALIELQKGEK